jgi:hypothetical protein
MLLFCNLIDDKQYFGLNCILHLVSWRWTQNVPPKRRHASPAVALGEHWRRHAQGLKMCESCCSAGRQMSSVCEVTAVVLGSVTSAWGWLCSVVKRLLIYEGMWTTMQQYRPICLAASHTIYLSLSHTYTNKGGLNRNPSELQMATYFCDTSEHPKPSVSE